MHTSSKNLLALQWSAYPNAHHDRRNLIIHLATVPIFMASTLLALGGFWLGAGAGLLGLAGMLLVLAVQGRGHRGERTSPLPFKGPLDFVLRVLAEQWITFPRFVLSGAFSRAWKGGLPSRDLGQ